MNKQFSIQMTESTSGLIQALMQFLLRFLPK
jgi:hypothetical protein